MSGAGPRARGRAAGGPGGLAAAAVLVLGVRLVDAALPTTAESRPADDPTEMRDRLARAVALGAVALAAAAAGRAVARRLGRR
mgnify:CR=1 FL=1